MIVICTRCQAKFRVADEKIGPRGAKVRCSRCQTVFRVMAGSAPASAAPQPLPPPSPAMDVELENPFAAGSAPGAAREQPAPVADDDPFAAAGFGVPVAPAPEPDPFAVPTPPVGDPFAAASAAQDPFAAPPAAAARVDGGPLAVTDLSDLLASVPPADVPAPAAHSAASPEMGLAPLGLPGDDGGLALEDRVTPPPLAAAGRRPFDAGGGGLPAGADPFGGDVQSFGAYDFGASEADPSLALAQERAAAPAPPPAPGAAAPAAEPAEPPAPAPGPMTPPPTPQAAAPAVEQRAPRPRRSRMRVVVVNAVALAALLLVAVTMLAVWRSEGRIDAISLRPSRLLAALGHGAADGPFTALEVRSGVYERERGPPILFVRGKVVSRAPSAVPGVRVAVEVVREEGVVARGEALAGAVPTPEELYRVVDPAGMAALVAAAAARAPPEVRPGDAVPFLVAIVDHPADLDGASLHLELAAAGGPAR